MDRHGPAGLAMTGGNPRSYRHCEEQGDEAIQNFVDRHASLAMTATP